MEDVQALQPGRNSWLNRNGWKLGFAFTAVLGAVWWRHAHRSQRINVGSVSERWLAEQAFSAGQQPPE